jgi:hypothetical protein
MLRAIPLLIILGLLILPAYAAQDVKLSNYYTYINSKGEPVIVGEVINDGREPVKSVQVKASFLDPSGNVLDSSSTWAAIDMIPPGQRSPFLIQGDTEYALNVKSFEIEVVSFDKGQSKPSSLEILNVSHFTDGIGEVGIDGVIANNGEKTATAPKVYATFYDVNNKVVGFASATSDPAPISPNEKAVFKIRIHELVPAIMSYTLYAESDQFSTTPFGMLSIGNPETGGKVGTSGLTLVDQQGNPMGKVAPNERGWIRSELKSMLSVEQRFAYIVQIKDQNGFPVELKWIDGTLEPKMSLSPSISWTPDREGIYVAEIFVWESMDNPVPLSNSIKTILLLAHE